MIFIISIPLFIIFPIIWLMGHLFEKPKATKFGKNSTIIAGILFVVLVAINLFRKKSK